MLPDDNHLCFSLSDMNEPWVPRLTSHHELLSFGGPVVIKKVLKVD